MEELVSLFVNNGTAIACLIYFMWYNSTTMKAYTEQMEKMNLRMEEMNGLLKHLIEKQEK